MHPYKNNQPVVWYHKSLQKSNQYCLYCKRFIGEGSTIESNKEHLVGNEFVPIGEFGSGTKFNFIFRACKECNNEKSNLERHISSVTLFSSPAREISQAHNDLAQRKATKDYHPTKRGMLVKDSGDEFKINRKIGSVNICYTISSPPQAEKEYIELLAFRHIQGIYSLIHSKDYLANKEAGILDRKFFYLHGSYVYSDWSNPQLLELMKMAQEIPCYANIKTANGFFKVIMRKKQDNDSEWWFWGLEWNKSLRIVGYIALPENTPEIFLDLPNLEWEYLAERNDGAVILSYQKDIPFDPETDILFCGKVPD